MPIKSVYARQIFDSRGNPTIEVDLITDLGLFRAAVPSGASTGTYEARELRDNEKQNYMGLSVFKAVNNVNEIIGPELVNSHYEVTQQTEIDELMIKLDGTENKSKLGANAILAISLAVCKAGAAKRGIPLYKHLAELAGNKHIVLPVPAFNVINGGIHAGNNLPLQEFMILPTGAHSFAEALKIGTEVYHNLKDVVKGKYGLGATAVADEGGFAPNVAKAEDAIALIVQAIKKAGYTGRVEIALDCAASEFFKDGKYDLDFKADLLADVAGDKKKKKEKKKKEKKKDKTKILTGAKLLDMYKGYLKKFPIVSVEDPFDQDDWTQWTAITSSTDVQIVGDDLTVTNPKRIQQAIEHNACNALLLKVNQIGTITEAIRAHLLAKSHGWGTMVSHRSGETEDSFIADLVVGLSTGQIKAGAPCRSERLAKYNQILRIEEELGENARYAGLAFRKPQ